MRERVTGLVEGKAFQAFILIVILTNAVTIGIQTARAGLGASSALAAFDHLCVAIYIVEAALKIYAWRGSYFRDGWNVFDFTIVALCCIPTTIFPFPIQVVRVLRVVRVFRVFRLVSAFREMRVIITSIGRAIPGVAWTSLLLLIVFYVFAVTGTDMFGTNFPDYFGSLGSSFLTLFQVMTLESWAENIARPVMEVFPWAWAYFVPFVIISAFVMVNIVVGIIVDVVEETRQESAAKELAEKRKEAGDNLDADLAEQLALLEAQVERVKELVSAKAAVTKDDD